MNTTDKFIRGLKEAEDKTGLTKQAACKKAGISYSTLWRFMTRQNDIQLNTLCALCEDGYGMSLNKILALGE